MDIMEENNFISLLLFYNGVSTEVVQNYFEIRCIEEHSFTKFLEKVKHNLFHEANPSVCCCECSEKPEKQGRLTLSQFQMLYENNNADITTHHLRNRKGETTQHCICQFSSKHSVEISSLDINLILSIIKSCNLSINQNLAWIQTIGEIRQFLAGCSSNRVSANKYTECTSKLETAVLGLSKAISLTFCKMVQRKIDEFREQDVKDPCSAVIERFHEVINDQSSFQDDPTEDIVEIEVENVTFLIRIDRTVSWIMALELQTVVDSEKNEDSGTCYIDWRFDSPTWDARHIISTLKSVSQLPRQWFQIESTCAKPFIIKTSLPSFIALDEREFNKAIKLFLENLIDTCRIPVDFPEKVAIYLSISEEPHTGSQFCYSCGHLEKKNTADIWCCDCESWICSMCLYIHNSMSKGHRLLSSSEYKTNPIIIKLQCRKHNNQLKLFCKTHEVPVCVECVPNHRKCHMVSIESMVPQHSGELNDIEEKMKNIYSDIENIDHSVTLALDGLYDRKESIKTELKYKMKEIRSIASGLEKAVLRDISKYEEELKGMKMEIELRKRNFRKIEENLNRVKTQPQSVETFIGVYDINKQILDNIENLGKMVKNERFVKIDPCIQISPDIVKRAFVQFNEEPICIAQNLKSYKFETDELKDIHLKLKTKVQVKRAGKENFITGASFISSEEVCLCDASNHRIVVVNIKEPNEETIPLPHKPIDITSIAEHKMAVTLSESRSICLIDTEEGEMEELKFSDIGSLGAVSSDNELEILIRVIGFGFYVLDLSGEIIEKIKIEDDFGIKGASFKTDKLYFTKWDSNKIVSCDLLGKVLWEFNGDSIIKAPTGITVDHKGYVYVSGLYSDNVIVVSADGKYYKEVIGKDIVQSPRALAFDEKTNTLLVSSVKGCIYFFQ